MKTTLAKIVLMGWLAAQTAAPVARTVTDDMNRAVTVPDKIERIAVADIYPFASVAAVFLGGAKKIAAIHPVSMSAAKAGLLGEVFPEILEADTRFMKGKSLDIERLMRIKPDVVFVNAGDAANIATLENAGIAAVAVSATKWDYDVFQTVEHWFDLLQRVFPERKLADRFMLLAADAVRRVNDHLADLSPARKKRVLFLFQYSDSRILTSGQFFFGEFWAVSAGAVNVAREITAVSSNAQINMEDIYRWNPDAVFITNFTPALPDDLYSNKFHNWTPVKAVEMKRVYKMPIGLYRSYTPSADAPLTLLWMAKTLYPKHFEDIDLAAEVKRYYQTLFGVTLTGAQCASYFEQKSGGAEGVAGLPLGRGR